MVNHEEIITRIINNNKQFLAYLQAIRFYTQETLWIGGGFIRTIVWDYEHKHKYPTEFIDIDVFYYQPNYLQKEKDLEIETFLHKIYPNAHWSVKNQARMHLHNNEEQYESLEEALKKFPDTASTIAVRLLKDDSFLFIAPYGYKDLFNLDVKPTPICLQSRSYLSKYRKRIIEKGWKKKWKNLKIHYI